MRASEASFGRFARHYGEMVVAMAVGMILLNVPARLLGSPPGYDDVLGFYGYMAVAMAAPMVAWMRRTGHPWSDCVEMTVAMLLPMFAIVLPVAFGLIDLTSRGLLMGSHLAMLVGMLALMLFRWSTYASDHAHHGTVTAPSAGAAAIDPVCGMAVDPTTAPWTLVHDGATYVFCAAGCRSAFAREPSRYLAPEYRPTM